MGMHDVAGVVLIAPQQSKPFRLVFLDLQLATSSDLMTWAVTLEASAELQFATYRHPTSTRDLLNFELDISVCATIASKHTHNACRSIFLVELHVNPVAVDKLQANTTNHEDDDLMSVACCICNSSYAASSVVPSCQVRGVAKVVHLWGAVLHDLLHIHSTTHDCVSVDEERVFADLQDIRPPTHQAVLTADDVDVATSEPDTDCKPDEDVANASIDMHAVMQQQNVAEDVIEAAAFDVVQDHLRHDHGYQHDARAVLPEGKPGSEKRRYSVSVKFIQTPQYNGCQHVMKHAGNIIGQLQTIASGDGVIAEIRCKIIGHVICSSGMGLVVHKIRAIVATAFSTSAGQLALSWRTRA